MTKNDQTALAPIGGYSEAAAAELEQASQAVQAAQSQAEGQSIIQAAVILTMQRPRNEDVAWQRITAMAKRPSMADRAVYSYPRGGTQVTGPTIAFIRAFAQRWGNIRFGVDILGETKQGATCRAWAWDLETNTFSSRDQYIERKVQRREGWKYADDPRDWREWLSNIGSRLERRALQDILPEDLIEDALELSASVRIAQYAEDPAKAQRMVIGGFGELGIPAEEIIEYLGKPIQQASASDLDTLRTIWKTIKAGAKAWRDYYQPENEGPIKGEISPEALTVSSDGNRGHDDVMPEPKADPLSDAELDRQAAQESGDLLSTQDEPAKRTRAAKAAKKA